MGKRKDHPRPNVYSIRLTNAELAAAKALGFDRIREYFIAEYEEGR